MKNIILWKISGDITQPDLIKLVQRFEEWTEMGYHICLIHGAGSQINEEITKQNIPITYFEGQRKTSLEVLNIVKTIAITQQSNIVRIANENSHSIKFFGIKNPIFEGVPLENYGYVLNPIYCYTEEIESIWSQGGIPIVHFLTENMLKSTQNVSIWNANADLCVRCLANNNKISKNLIAIGFTVGNDRDINLLKESLSNNICLDDIPDFVKTFEQKLGKGFLLKLQEINDIYKNCQTDATIDKIYLTPTKCELPKTLSDNSNGIWIRRKKHYYVGLIGSRGFIGSEIKKYLDNNKYLKCISFKGDDWNYLKSQERDIDLWISCCPNNILKENLPKVNLNKPIIDVSSDHRHLEGWRYGLCYVDKVDNSHKRISNAGCYSTAVNCALKPIVDNFLIENISVTGISSYSGAGRDYQDKFPTLQNTLIAYDPLKHVQQKEMSTYLGLPINFVPIVSDQFDRGILASIQVTLSSAVDVWDIDY